MSLLKMLGNHNLVLNGWLGLLLVLPWVNVYTSGPTPNAWPWLVSACCAVLLFLARTRLTVGLVSASWIVAAVLSALMGIAQYFGLAQAFSPWISQTGPAEAFANLRQRNQFATLTSIGLASLLGMLAQRAQAGRLPGWAHLAVSLLAVGNAVSGSRTGLLQWILVLSLSAWWFLPRQRHLATLAVQAVLTYLVALAALPWLLSAIAGFNTGGLWERLVDAPTCASRRVLWSNVLHLISQKPWLGWGWGELDYAHYVTLYDGPRFCEILDNAHNLPLHLAVELGIPVALILCCGLMWWLWRQQPWHEVDPARQLAWAVLVLIGLHSLLEYPLWYGPFQIAVGLCAFMLLRRQNIQIDRKLNRKWALSDTSLALFAVIFIAIMSYAGLDYYRISQIYRAPEDRAAAYRNDTLKKIRSSWLFANQVRFAELSITPLTQANAQWTFDAATALLHYSPEPRVIEKVIESAVMLGRDEEAMAHLVRYRAAFPLEHARWAQENAKLPEAVQRMP